MDLLKIITELQEERHRLQEAIEALERLSASSKRYIEPAPGLEKRANRRARSNNKSLPFPLPKSREKIH